MDILGIIPARGGSKGLHRKNIKLLANKPLISYTIEEALKSNLINKVVVSTDDMEIADISKRFGAEVPCLRPAEISRDNSQTIEAVLHMLDWLKNNENYVPDYVCLLQCTSPLRKVEDIDGTIKKMFDTNMDAAVSICEAEVNPYWTNIMKGDRLEYFIEEGKKIFRRQDLPVIYRLNGAVYVAKTNLLINNKTFELERITGFIMDNEKSIDIDNSIDFQLVELLMKKSD